MTIVVNGDERRLASGTTVADVVVALGRGERGIAVAVNGEVVPRRSWPGRALIDADRVEVLTAAQGG